MPTDKPLPSGRITIVFTDIENSSVMTKDMGNTAYIDQIRNPHQEILTRAFERHGGAPIQTAGDSFMAVFQYAADALACAASIQNSFKAEPIFAGGATRTWTLAVRIGVHTTEQEVHPTRLPWLTDAELVAGQVEYPGTDTNFAARVGALGVGGQIVVSNSTYLAADTKAQYDWRGWPDRRLKSFESMPETVWELLYDGQSRGEPGSRWVPDWYRGELNRYIPRPELQERVIGHFKAARDGARRRLVTLHAEGGMGKSRLAVACAIEMVGLFQKGVHFVNLAHDEDEQTPSTRETVAQDIGLALGLSNTDLQIDKLLASLASSQTLLILDNYESVQCKDVRLFVRDLITKTTSLCILVTGRTAVKLPDIEQIVSMNDGMSAGQARSLLLEYVALTERAADWTPDEEEEVDLQRILTLTERIPLAVELAAAWAGPRTIKEIADGLKRTPLGRMTKTPGESDRADTSPHHYSLTRSLGWSFSLLNPGAQAVFGALGLFADSFGKDAVAVVLAQEIDDAEDLLDYLYSVSLVRRVERSKTTRYMLHRFTREYALGKLADQAEAESIRRRFVDYYSKLVRQNENMDQPEQRGVLANEWQNATTALKLAEGRTDWKSAVAFIGLGKFLEHRGLWADQEALYRSVLDAARAAGDQTTEAKATFGLGEANQFLCRWDAAKSSYAEALAQFTNLADHSGEAHALAALGYIHQIQSEWDKAESVLGQSLELFRELGDADGESRSLNILGRIYELTGRRDQSEAALTKAASIQRELGNHEELARSLVFLGFVYMNRLPGIKQKPRFWNAWRYPKSSSAANWRCEP